MKQVVIIALVLFSVMQSYAATTTFTENRIEVKAPKTKKATGPNGTYYCARSRDYYSFSSNHTGKFITGYVTSKFTWQLKGSFVYVTYGHGGGTTKLQYNRSKDYLIESSSMLGTLVFEKTTGR